MPSLSLRHDRLVEAVEARIGEAERLEAAERDLPALDDPAHVGRLVQEAEARDGHVEEVRGQRTEPGE